MRTVPHVRRVVLLSAMALCILMALMAGCGETTTDAGPDSGSLTEDRQQLHEYLLELKQYHKDVRAVMHSLQEELGRAPERMELPYREELAGQVTVAADDLRSAELQLDFTDPPQFQTSDVDLRYAHKLLLKSTRSRIKMAWQLLDAVTRTPRRSQWKTSHAMVTSWYAADYYDAFWDEIRPAADQLDVEIPFKPLPNYMWFGTP